MLRIALVSSQIPNLRRRRFTGNFRFENTAAISLVELLTALAILSTLLLPMGMFLLEYQRGSTNLSEFHRILSMVDERLEVAMGMPYKVLPPGISENILIEHSNESGLDLRPASVGGNTVRFYLNVESVPLELTAVSDAKTGRQTRAKVDDGMKRLKITAVWGKDKEHSLYLTAYKADL